MVFVRKYFIVILLGLELLILNLIVNFNDNYLLKVAVGILFSVIFVVFAYRHSKYDKSKNQKQ